MVENDDCASSRSALRDAPGPGLLHNCGSRIEDRRAPIIAQIDLDGAYDPRLAPVRIRVAPKRPRQVAGRVGDVNKTSLLGEGRIPVSNVENHAIPIIGGADVPCVVGREFEPLDPFDAGLNIGGAVGGVAHAKEVMPESDAWLPGSVNLALPPE